MSHFSSNISSSSSEEIDVRQIGKNPCAKYFAIALIATGIAIAALGLGCGAIVLFGPQSVLPHWLAVAVGTIGHRGGIALMAGGGGAGFLLIVGGILKLILDHKRKPPLEESIEERVRAKFERTIKENSDHLTQPVYRKGKWFYQENQANHRLEATVIFFETQVKRLGRLFTFNQTLKYFSQNETDEEIYAELLDDENPPAEPYFENIGHATQLFHHEMTILTDPVFNDLNSLLYPRKTKPGREPEDLPPIDVLLITHNHRDHCDVKSLKQLVPHQPIVLAPKGDFRLFKDLGFTQVHELDWWTKTTITKDAQSIDFFCLPACHWSGRGAFDAQKSLTCSWAFKAQADTGAVYFRGDTANIPSTTTAEIKEFIDAPIMANFEPGGPNYTRRLMRSTHQSVLDSMMTHFDLSTEGTSMHTYLMHHNAYELGRDRFNEAVIIKDLILDYLKTPPTYRTDEDFERLPKFVQDRFNEGLLTDIEEIENFIKSIEDDFHSPKIGEHVQLAL